VSRSRSSRPGGARRTAVLHGLFALILVICAACLFGLSGCSDQVSQALELEQKGDVDGALALYSKILAAEPDNIEALTGASVCLMMLNRFDEALPLQEHLVGLHPGDAQACVELGFNYLVHQSRPQDAVVALGEAAKIDPRAKYQCFLAQAQEAAGDVAGAEQTLRGAMDAEPGYAYSYKLLSGLLQRQGRAQEAQQVLEKAASLGVDVTKAS
jgi:tetratricopeptide (TPR) repeat protein